MRLNLKYYSFYKKHVVIGLILKIFMNARTYPIACARNPNSGSFLILEVIFKDKKFKIDFIVEKIKIR